METEKVIMDLLLFVYDIFLLTTVSKQMPHRDIIVLLHSIQGVWEGQVSTLSVGHPA